MAIYRNQAGQKLAVFAYTPDDGQPATGDAASITAYLSKDWAAPAAITDTNPTELDAVNMPGWYVFDLAQAETDAEVLIVAPKSATAGVVLDQVQVFTLDATISSRASQTSVDDVPTVAELNAVSADIYTAKVWMFDDEGNATDRYAVVWYKNGVPVVADITTPLIQVIKMADGTDLVASSAMTEAGTTEMYYYNEAANRMVSGAAYMIKVTATIDGSARTWYEPCGRDSSA